MNILAASTSTLHGDTYLNYLRDEVTELFSGCNNVTFIPFARPGGISWDEYTEYSAKFFKGIGIALKGINYGDIQKNLEDADGFFTGGGNTFVLLKTLQEHNLIEQMSDKVRSGIPYLGSSAGSNITGQTIKTTNDMPIVEVNDFTAMKLLPFNINPHFKDPSDLDKHMGETRETRIKEYLRFNSNPVVGLREGSYIRVKNNEIMLRGSLSARIFRNDQDPTELEANSSIEL